MMNPKISILLAAFGILGLFELFYSEPQFFYAGMVLANLILVFTLRTLPDQKFKDKNYWNFLILPLLFLNSAGAYLSLLTNKILIHFLIIFTVLFIYSYLRRIYLYQVYKHLNIDLANITSLGALLIIFFSATSLYGLRVSLHFPIWVLILNLLVLTTLVTHKVFWINKIPTKKSLLFILVLDLVVVEIGWALFFLSFSYLVLGVILTICYYIIIGLTKFHLKETLDKRRLKFYLGCGLSAIFLILLTAQILFY